MPSPSSVNENLENPFFTSLGNNKNLQLVRIQFFSEYFWQSSKELHTIALFDSISFSGSFSIAEILKENNSEKSLPTSKVFGQYSATSLFVLSDILSDVTRHFSLLDMPAIEEEVINFFISFDRFYFFKLFGLRPTEVDGLF